MPMTRRAAPTAARLAHLGRMPPSLTAGGGTSPAASDASIRHEITRFGGTVRRPGASPD